MSDEIMRNEYGQPICICTALNLCAIHKPRHRMGWFADFDPEADPRWPWKPMLQTPSGTLASIDSPSFTSEQDCIDFIRDEIIGYTFLPGEDKPNMHLRR